MVDRVSDSNPAAAVDTDFATDSSSSSGTMLKAIGFAANHSFSNLKRFEFERVPAKAHKVELETLFPFSTRIRRT